MHDPQQLLFQLFVMFAAAKLLEEIFHRLGQPTVVGEICAGILVGPYVLGLVHPGTTIEGMAEIGAIFLLFTIGLETSPAAFLGVRKTAGLVAILGVVLPFLLGFYYLRMAGGDFINSIFLGAAMVATSVGITARVLKDGNAIGTRAARVILAAAVLDDILGMIVLAVVTSLASGGINYVQLAVVSTEAIGLSLFMIFFGSGLVSRLVPALDRLRISNSAFVLSLLLCLGLSLASVYIGMAAIIGAFLAGLALADHSEAWGLHKNVHPIYEFTGPFFFVYLGMQVDVRTVAAPGVLSTLGIVCVLAFFSKLVGCGLGAASLGARDALRVGVGMTPRGEVGLIVAAVGLTLHAISADVYTVVLLMSLVTTLVAPPLVRILFRAPVEASLADHSPPADS